MSNTFTKGYADGAALTEAELDTAYQTLQLDIANTALATTGSTSGQALLSNGSAVAASFQTIPDPQGPFALRNYGLKATVASGVMTVSLTTKAGTAPSGSDKVDFNYSTNGTTSASYTSVQIATATTFTLNASASLGYTETSTSRIFVYGYYNSAAAAVKLAVSARSDFDGAGSVLTTSVSASSDSRLILYATAALTIMPRLLGHVDAAHNSAGAWQTSSKVNIENVSLGQRGVVVATSGTGAFTSSAGSWTDVTNATLSILTTGRPVKIELLPDASVGSPSSIGVDRSSGTTADVEFRLLRGTSTIGYYAFSLHGASGNLYSAIPGSALNTIDFPGAGTYTYKLQSQVIIGGVLVGNCKLAAYEL